jgi:omega-hydroxy-beta-dihydromenaquinone-9 sulfotransferase
VSQTLYGSRALADWVLAGGRPARRPWAHTARLRWHAYWFEQNWRTELERLAALPLPKNPVFIIGPWRSGTTLLHELLTASTGWSTPHTWQCFNPSTCFLMPAPRDSMMPRPMDEGLISTRGPQEDEFAALLLGEESLYRAFIDPRRLLECAARLWQGGQTLPRWQAFVRGIAAQAADQRLLLKSPNHTFRLPLLRDCFPRAQFVWIGRRSGEVLTSNLKMWRAMMQRYALWECPQGVLETFLAQAIQACTQVLGRCLDDMSREQLLWVDFETLRCEPRRVVLAVLAFLQVESAVTGAEGERRLEEALRRTPIHAGSRTLAPGGASTAALDELMAVASERFGTAAVAPSGPNR